MPKGRTPKPVEELKKAGTYRKDRHAARDAGDRGRGQREPLARTTLYSGPANCFQRRGDVSLGGHTDGSLPGLDQRALTVPGMARVTWTNPPPGGEECR